MPLLAGNWAAEVGGPERELKMGPEANYLDYLETVAVLFWPGQQKVYQVFAHSAAFAVYLTEATTRAAAAATTATTTTTK